jgi:hypothetical protein
LKQKTQSIFRCSETEGTGQGIKTVPEEPKII